MCSSLSWSLITRFCETVYSGWFFWSTQTVSVFPTFFSDTLPPWINKWINYKFYNFFKKLKLFTKQNHEIHAHTKQFSLWFLFFRVKSQLSFDEEYQKLFPSTTLNFEIFMILYYFSKAKAKSDLLKKAWKIYKTSEILSLPPSQFHVGLACPFFIQYQNMCDRKSMQ